MRCCRESTVPLTSAHLEHLPILSPPPHHTRTVPSQTCCESQAELSYIAEEKYLTSIQQIPVIRMVTSA